MSDAKTFHPAGPPAEVGDAAAVGKAVPSVEVAEVTAERTVDDPPEIPWHIRGPAGTVRMQLRSTVRRVVVGAGLARRPGLIDEVRRLPDVEVVVTSPAGGTFIVGGASWLGLCAIGVPEPGRPMPLDWMLHALRAWFEGALQPLGVPVTVGRVEGAWCPGFSDIAVDGRKLAGLGFRVTRDWVVMRGVVAVRPVDDRDLRVLQACHRLIGLEVDRARTTSLVEATGEPSWTVDRAISMLCGMQHR